MGPPDIGPIPRKRDDPASTPPHTGNQAASLTPINRLAQSPPFGRKTYFRSSAAAVPRPSSVFWRRCGRSKHLVTIVHERGKIGIVFLTLFLHQAGRFHGIAIAVNAGAGAVNARTHRRSKRNAVVAREGEELRAERVIATLAKFR
jgi:hypothetical protein